MIYECYGKINRIFMMHLAVFKWIFNYVEITIVLQHFTTSLDNISGDK